MIWLQASDMSEEDDTFYLRCVAVAKKLEYFVDLYLVIRVEGRETRSTHHRYYHQHKSPMSFHTSLQSFQTLLFYFVWTLHFLYMHLLWIDIDFYWYRKQRLWGTLLLLWWHVLRIANARDLLIMNHGTIRDANSN